LRLCHPPARVPNSSRIRATDGGFLRLYRTRRTAEAVPRACSPRRQGSQMPPTPKAAAALHPDRSLLFPTRELAAVHDDQAAPVSKCLPEGRFCRHGFGPSMDEAMADGGPLTMSWQFNTPACKIVFAGCSMVTFSLQGVAPAYVGLSIVRFKPYGLSAIGNCLVEFPLLFVSLRPAAIRPRRSWIEPDGTIEGSDSRVVVPPDKAGFPLFKEPSCRLRSRSPNRHGRQEPQQ